MKDMKKVLLRTYYENKELPTFEELTADIGRFFHYWNASREDIINYYEDLCDRSRRPRLYSVTDEGETKPNSYLFARPSRRRWSTTESKSTDQ